MAIKRYKPTSNGVRNMTVVKYKDFLTGKKNAPHKSLTKGTKNTAARNNRGRITSRFRGGGNKRLFRTIDFKFDKRDIPAKIETVEYDPFRSAFISLVVYADGERRYILSWKNAKEGEKFVVSDVADIEIGNRMRLKNIPVGTMVYNVEIKPEGGAKLARSAGNSIEVAALDDGTVNLKMPSGEVRKVSAEAFATIGEASNSDHRLVNIGKAGRARQMRRRPKVRGSAMNPVDHPYGGGEGKAGVGLRRLKSKWGKPTGKGQKTRTQRNIQTLWLFDTEIIRSENKISFRSKQKNSPEKYIGEFFCYNMFMSERKPKLDKAEYFKIKAQKKGAEEIEKLKAKTEKIAENKMVGEEFKDVMRESSLGDLYKTIDDMVVLFYEKVEPGSKTNAQIRGKDNLLLTCEEKLEYMKDVEYLREDIYNSIVTRLDKLKEEGENLNDHLH